MYQQKKYGNKNRSNKQNNRRINFSKNRNSGKSSRKLDYSKFINKAVITEEVEKFIPQNNFSDFKINEALKKSVINKGYVLPTPIQDRAIPYILKGIDVVGIAQTGTGKTAAFLIPLIEKILNDKSQKIMIIVPTRELAIQINDELRMFTKNMKLFSVCCVGGIKIHGQIRELCRPCNFIIGTPGRLKDLIDRNKIKTNEYKTVVLDEADRMLDMGFINDMKKIMSGMPADRQTLFFSATLSPEIEKLINDFLKEPIRIQVATRQTSDHINQDVIRVSKNEEKIDVLINLLKNPKFEKVLIFGRTKHGVDKIAKKLNNSNIKSESIHGDKPQPKRQKALTRFKKGEINVLVATDVAARGLDIRGVSHVINYDMPATDEDYVHRIGRTGRAGKSGEALTFIN